MPGEPEHVQPAADVKEAVAQPQHQAASPPEGGETAHPRHQQPAETGKAQPPAPAVRQQSQRHLEGKGAEVVEQKAEGISGAGGADGKGTAEVHGKVGEGVGGGDRRERTHGETSSLE